jgi:hypothetical protein
LPIWKVAKQLDQRTFPRRLVIDRSIEPIGRDWISFAETQREVSACQLGVSARILQTSRKSGSQVEVSIGLAVARVKLFIKLLPHETVNSAGKFTNLRSGKATTLSKRRITAPSRALAPPTATHAGDHERQCAPLKLRKRDSVPNKRTEVVRFLPACPSGRTT